MGKIISKKGLWLLFVPAAVFILLLLPIQIPYQIHISGKLLPAAEWTLTKGSDGRLISQVKDNLNANSRHYSVNLFERGDLISFDLLRRIRAGFRLQKGDTVGFINSQEVRRKLSILQGDLAAKKAELRMYGSGEKEALLAIARQNLQTAQKKAKMQRQILARQKELFEQNLISKEKYEIEQTKKEVMDADVQLAEARLRNQLQGAKGERLDYIRSQIAAIEHELEIYKKRLQTSVILAPFAGIVSSSFSADTLLRLIDMKKLVFIFPLLAQDKKYVLPGQTIEMDFSGQEGDVSASVSSVSNSVFGMGGRQVFMAAAAIDNEKGAIAPGLMTQGRAQCGQISLAEFVKRSVIRMAN